MNTKFYKYCAVPMCNSTAISTPDKLFIYVPKKKDIRRKWLTLARRDPASLTRTSTIYFCEDHFDLQKDMENYVEYTTMGTVSQIRMNAGCLPTKFACQTKIHITTSDLYRPAENHREDMDEGEDTSTEAEDALEVKDEPLSDTEFVEEHHDVKIEQADDIEEQYLTNNKNYDVKIPEIVNELFCSETSNASSSYVNSEHSSSWNLRDNIRKKDDDEFGIFGQNVAAQLRQLKLVNALEAQAKISALLTECRLKQLKDSGGH